jgi:hypothetical protein
MECIPVRCTCYTDALLFHGTVSKLLLLNKNAAAEVPMEMRVRDSRPSSFMTWRVNVASKVLPPGGTPRS